MEGDAAVPRLTTKAVGWVRAHFAAYRRRDKRAFFWRMALESLIVPLVLSGIFAACFHLPDRTDLRDMTPARLIIMGGIVGPFLETFLGQALPIAVVRALRGSFWVQVVVSTVVFAAPHFAIAASSGIGAGLFTGFYIAFTYAHWRETSFRAALWMTSGLHAAHNLALIIPYILAGQGRS